MPTRDPTFWCEPTGFAEVRLRVFTFGDYLDHVADPDRPDHERCPAAPVTQGGSMDGYQSGHDASAVVFEYAEERRDEQGRQELWPVAEFDGNPAWPNGCVRCGAPVGDGWVRQVNQDPYYRATFSAVPEGEAFVGLQWRMRLLPVGAMYELSWLSDVSAWCGDDGMALAIVIPDGKGGTHVFQPDSGASNCTRQGEPHHCWCRTGNPRADVVTVGKDCDTCSAGAGSIGVPGGPNGSYAWHGYVREGFILGD